MSSAPSVSATNASVNGHVHQDEEEHPQVLSHVHEEQVARDRGHYLEGDTDRNDPDHLPGSDPYDDSDLGSWEEDDLDAENRRVKVYELVEQNWTDLGTGYCQGYYNEETRQARLIACAENSNEILLESIIHTNGVYQRQQDTLIVWTEPDGTDYALSFQDIEGCGEVWEFIGEVQRYLQDNDVSRL